MTKTIEETFAERHETHGRYKPAIMVRSRIMKILVEHNQVQHEEVGTPLLDDVMKTAIGDIVLKLVRASINPKNPDNFHDIQGYAKLIEQELIDNE